MVDLVDPVGGGRGRSIQECCHRGHILASPGKSMMRRTFMDDGGSNGSIPSLGFCEVDGGGSLCPLRVLVSV
jgi:hypothetical protein